ncbi:MAG: hypothetical protein ABH879_02770 [archaeon]
MNLQRLLGYSFVKDFKAEKPGVFVADLGLFMKDRSFRKDIGIERELTDKQIDSLVAFLRSGSETDRRTFLKAMGVAAEALIGAKAQPAGAAESQKTSEPAMRYDAPVIDDQTIDIRYLSFDAKSTGDFYINSQLMPRPLCVFINGVIAKIKTLRYRLHIGEILVADSQMVGELWGYVNHNLEFVPIHDPEKKQVVSSVEEIRQGNFKHLELVRLYFQRLGSSRSGRAYEAARLSKTFANIKTDYHAYQADKEYLRKIMDNACNHALNVLDTMSNISSLNKAVKHQSLALFHTHPPNPSIGEPSKADVKVSVYNKKFQFVIANRYTSFLLYLIVPYYSLSHPSFLIGEYDIPSQFHKAIRGNDEKLKARTQFRI